MAHGQAAAPGAPEPANVFLSHAGSEKRLVVNVIHHELERRGISTFVDYTMEMSLLSLQATFIGSSRWTSRCCLRFRLLAHLRVRKRPSSWLPVTLATLTPTLSYTRP